VAEEVLLAGEVQFVVVQVVLQVEEVVQEEVY
jgi:hypothetical protein